MKRCPQCNYIESDDALTYCRADGTLLVHCSFSFTDCETVVLKNDAPSATTIIDEATDRSVAPTELVAESMNAPAASTTLLKLPETASHSRKLAGMKKRHVIVASLAAIIALTLAAWAYYSLSTRENVFIGSLAVLPFLNVNADQQIEYLSDGLTETLISRLSQLPKLNVKAHSSVFRYKGKEVSPQTVGSDLGVQAILSGRILQRGDWLTLSLELSDARTENVIWSEQYNRKLTDLIFLQSEIVRDVLNELRVRLSGADEQRLSKSQTANPQANQLYLKGRFYWNKRTVKDLEKALEYFNQAITLDPNYALAYAGLADTYVLLPFYSNEPVREAMPRAREAAMKALSLDGDLAEAHATLGFVKTHEYDFNGAEREYKRAIELNPNYATAYQWYGELLSYLGRHEEALAEMQSALELDPLSLIINVWCGNSLFYARRYGEAIAQLKKALELDAGFAKTHKILANIYQMKANYAEAAGSYAKYRELTGEHQGAALIRESFAKGGWQGFLRAMTAKEQQDKLSPYEKVVFLAALGEKDKAFDELSRSYEGFGPLLKVEPLLDPLRHDPRFGEILRRSGLS